MVPVVILALALVSPAFTFPFSTQGSVPTGITETHTGVETVNTGFTHGEKTGIEGQSQTYIPTTGIETSNPVIQQVEKTGFQGVPQTQVTQQIVDTVRPGFQGEHSGLTEKTTGYEPVQHVVPTGTQVSQQTYVDPKYNENQQTVVKTESEPVTSEQTQGTYTERPILLPIQSLSVLPVTPLVVPAEAISTGRLIIMTVEPIRQRFLQDVTVTNPTQQQTVQQYVPVQPQVVEPSQQVFNVQPEVVTNPVSNVEKQGQYQQESQTPVTSVVPVQTQVPQIRNQPVVGEYTQIPTQTVEQQYVPQTQTGNVEKQGSTYTPTQTQGYEQGNQQQVYNTQPIVKTTGEQQQYQQVGYTPVQSPVSEPQQQVYNVPVEQVVPNQQVVPQTQGQVYKTQGVETTQQQYTGVQSQVSNYVAPTPVGSNFGDKIQPNQPSQTNYEPVQTLSVAPVNNVPSVVPSSVVVPQQQVVSQ